MVSYEQLFKQPLRKLLINYYRVRYNPDLSFSGRLLEQLGFRPCTACGRQLCGREGPATLRLEDDPPAVEEVRELFEERLQPAGPRVCSVRPVSPPDDGGVPLGALVGALAQNAMRGVLPPLRSPSQRYRQVAEVRR